MASPAKRRVLAPLDANASTPATSASSSVLLSPAAIKAGLVDNSNNNNYSCRPSTATGACAPPRSLPLSPPSSSSPFSSISLTRAASPSSAAAKKRPRDDGDEHADTKAGATAAKVTTPWKKMSTSTSTNSDRAYRTRPSLSPAPSSVFDVSSGSLVDPSQTTNITEPDVAGASLVRNASRPLLTREQSRQRAEILRLRLGLARYKLRTGQVDVPLEQLRMVPPSMARRANDNDDPFARVSLSLSAAVPAAPAAPAATSAPSEERSGSLASEWVRQQQQQRQQPQLPQQPLRRSYHSRNSSRSSSGSGGRSEAMKDVENEEDAEDAEEDEDDGENQDGEDDNADEQDDSADEEELPGRHQKQAAAAAVLATPRPSRQLLADDNGDHHQHHPAGDLTSSAMRGSAVSGLLSLARS